MRLLMVASLLAISFSIFSVSSGFADEPTQSWRKITKDVVYGHKHGLALTYDVIQPTKNANGAGVLFMVSGGWVSMWIDPDAVVREKPTQKNVWEKIVDAGFTLYLVRHGSSPLFKVPDAVDDVKSAIKHIRAHAEEFDVDPNRIGVTGGSAGGHLSLMLGTTGQDGDPNQSDKVKAASSRVQCVACYYPPTDLRTYVGPDKPIVKQFPALDFPLSKVESVSPLLHVSSDDAPTLLIHGDKDELVPLWHSEKIKDAFAKENVVCELIVVEGAAHGFPGQDGQRAEAALVDWLKKHLLEQK